MIVQRICDAAKENGLCFRKYSGRNMYGRSCPAIIGSATECRLLVALVISTIAEEMFNDALDAEDVEDAHQIKGEFDDVLSKIMLWQSDDMGISDKVMYWPNIDWEEVEETEGDEERE